MPPLVSVVMPVYNAMPYLPMAVDSILRQTYGNFRLIILDDGSTDGGVPYLNSLNDDRVMLLADTKNRGYTYRITQGLALAQGQYVARQDADDLSLPQRLERQVSILEHRPRLAAVFCAYQTMSEADTIVSTAMPPTGYQTLREVLLYDNPLAHGTVMFRRDCLESVGSYDLFYEPAEDYELWTRLAENFEIDVVPEVLYQLRIYPTSVSGTRRIEQRRIANQIRHLAFARASTAPVPARSQALHYFVVALHEISENDAAAATMHLAMAAKVDPSLEENSEQLTCRAVDLAVELGPSGRALIRTDEDEVAAIHFLGTLLRCLPTSAFDGVRANLFAEYHAACAYLYHQQKRPWKAASHVLRSWKHGSRHRRNRGMIKQILQAFR